MLLTDVDRFVDELYRPAAGTHGLSLISLETHRYAGDLNRFPTDVDADSVEGASSPSGTHPHGYFWVKTTTGISLMPKPVSASLHAELVAEIHDPFHARIAAQIKQLKQSHPGRPIYHLDCHSMPSRGTESHPDAGAERAEVVLSDFEGRSTRPEFLSLVKDAFCAKSFKVAINDPYKGGRITQRYGKPAQGHHTIQIELNRKLYMDEATKAKLPGFDALQARLRAVIDDVVQGLSGESFKS